ncbi:unnamed protein product, partial [Protopolystoma xenopodis]
MEKQVFLSLFTAHLLDLAECLWDSYASGSELVLHEYARIVEDLEYERQKVRYFVGLLAYEEIPLGKINTLLSWFTLGTLKSSPLVKAVIDSLVNHSANDNGESASFSKEALITWLLRNLPDIADDLASIVSYSLHGGECISTSFTLLSEYGGILMQPDTIWLLSASLSPPFKRCGDTALKGGAPLQAEQLSHLRCLFNSASDGLSLTRIVETSFDYDGPLLLLLKAGDNSFCFACDEGLKNSWNPYGDRDSKVLQLEPRTSKRGFLAGHRPLESPVLEIDENFLTVRITGGLPVKIVSVEIWAAGAPTHLAKLRDLKKWNAK